jgi:hypothetical protein
VKLKSLTEFLNINHTSFGFKGLILLEEKSILVVPREARFEKKNLVQCLLFSVEQPNFLVFTWCGEFHFSFARPVATFQNKLPSSGVGGVVTEITTKGVL